MNIFIYYEIYVYLIMKEVNMKKGFTLAEVLITLGIIGVVAAITIPTLVNNIQDRHFKALWKKAYSDISNAYADAFMKNPINMPNRQLMSYSELKLYSQEIYYQVLSRLTEDYCVTEATQGKACNSNYDTVENVSPGCMSLNPEEVINRCMYAGSGGYGQLTNGIRIYAQGYLWHRPAFLVDVNGKKKPNIVGRDMFVIVFRNNKVIPGGAPEYPCYGCDKSIQSSPGWGGPHTKSGSGCGYKYLYE